MQMPAVKSWLVRIAAGLLLLAGLCVFAAWMYARASLPALDGTISSAGMHAQVTVARDDRGVPLISGADRGDLAYATGFVHAQDRFFQMDLLRRVGAGELAELFGQKALALDRSRRLHRFRARAELALRAMAPDERAFLERYVAGINDGLNALTANPFEYALVGARPRLWTAADSLLVVSAMYFDLQGSLQPRELARGWLLDNSTEEQRAFLLPEASQWDAAIDVASMPAPTSAIPATAPAWWGKSRAGTALRVAAADFADSVGSNNWAVAGSRTKDGAAIVADDMHLGIQMPNIWYRVALQFPDAHGKLRRIVGVTLPGALPTIVVGSNGRVAWGYTNSYGDYLDLVTLEIDPTKPGQVRTPAGWETPVAHQETIIVKGAAAHQLVVRETSIGPVQQIGNKAYAIHWLAHAPGAVNMNPSKMELVDTIEEALAVANTLGIPAQNFVGGDDKGNIGWTIAGKLPRRAQADVRSSFPIPADGSYPTFDGSIKPDDYPRVVNPPNGQLATANNRQLIGAGGQKIGDGGFDIGARNQQVSDALLALGPTTNLAAVYGVSLDDRALFMAPWRARAMQALDAQAVKARPQRAEFLALLKNSWSGRASVDSVGYRLAREFMWSMNDVLYGAANEQLKAIDDKATMAMVNSRWPVVVARLLDEQPPGWLPPGHANWRAVQLAAIDRAIAELTKNGGTLATSSWGARNTVAIAHPIAQGAPFLKRWLTAPPDQLPGDANMPRVSGARFGQSERLTVSPGKEEQGVFNMPGGQSGHPLSAFFLKGHADWVAGTPTPLLPGPAKHTLTFVK